MTKLTTIFKLEIDFPTKASVKFCTPPTKEEELFVDPTKIRIFINPTLTLTFDPALVLIVKYFPVELELKVS